MIVIGQPAVARSIDVEWRHRTCDPLRVFVEDLVGQWNEYFVLHGRLFSYVLIIHYSSPPWLGGALSVVKMWYLRPGAGGLGRG